MSTWLTTWSERMRAQLHQEIHQEIWQESNQDGRQKGRQEGRQEGEAAVLLRQLTRRFGPLGAPVTEKIRQASPAELEQWADNILDARSLDAVFQPH